MIATLLWILWLVLWYCIGQWHTYLLHKNLMQKNKEVARMTAAYEKYVPVTEKHKAEIIRLHNVWMNYEQISRMLKIDSSAINRAVKRWQDKTVQSCVKY